MNSITKELTQVTCAIIVDEGKILAALRQRQMSQNWKWEFPGGKIDEGESHEDCIRREIKEELNIHISITGKLTPIIHCCPEKSIELIPFICSIEKGKVNAVDHEKVCWFTPTELKSLNWAEADFNVMQEFFQKHKVDRSTIGGGV
ncbi:(deoxy)nucleoside triphosphate pyrophosphohydrolase [Carboxylicivirga taeanensis]|uniref:(deoxy)nucleoside triphosphate pyrophosphohydrolase n=1 Tax=Carboxylicivirga taeanensis TaxID=1416875 RepID=UPI003F6DC63E